MTDDAALTQDEIDIGLVVALDEPCGFIHVLNDGLHIGEVCTRLETDSRDVFADESPAMETLPFPRDEEGTGDLDVHVVAV
jgi:hypothetical protein